MRLDKDETALIWIDTVHRFRQDVVALKRLTAPEKPALTRY